MFKDQFNLLIMSTTKSSKYIKFTSNTTLSTSASNENVIHTDYSCFTKTRRYECNFTWVINNLSLYFCAENLRGDHALKSQPFSATNNACKWYLELRPTYRKIEYGDYDGRYYSREPTSLCFKANDPNEIDKFGPILGKLECSLINSEGKKFNTKKSNFSMDQSRDSFKLTPFIEDDDLFKEENKLLIKDELTIHCEVSYIQKTDISHIMHLTSFSLPSSDPMEDFEKLFNNEDCSDVTIFVNDKKFPAHKAILAARSPVFKAMFTHSMEENHLNRIDIKDIDNEIFREMLRYIYTGKVENMETLAFELLLVADKYNIEGLRFICENAVCCTISTETVLKTLLYADSHNLQALKSEAVKFIIAHTADVIASQEWKDFTSRSDLMKEISEACSKRQDKM